MKINHKKLNSSLFFIGIALSIIIQLLNFAVMKYSFSQFRIILAASIIAVTACFYRFNNGLIALIRGKFGKPNNKDIHFVDYDNVKNKNEIKQNIGDSLLVYKLNSKDSYQIIKQAERLLIRRCFITSNLDECVYETDISNADNIKFAKGDISIKYDSIDKITYKISPSNYYTAIIEIKVGKKTYRYIGLLEEFNYDEIANFFNNTCNVKANKENANRIDKKLKIEKNTFIFRIINLIACLSVPNTVACGLFLTSSKAHFLASIYMLLSVAVLIAYVVLPIISPECFVIFDDSISYSKSTKSTLIGAMLIDLVLLLVIIRRQTILNTFWYASILIISILVIAFFYYKAYRKLIITNKKSELIINTCAIVLVLGITCACIVGGINYSIPLKSYSQTYTIEEKWREASSKGGTNYYAYVRIDGKQKQILISNDTYNSNSSRIQIVRARGILGIEYIAEDISVNN